ncbi:MAG: phosphotransferase enzyme family protein [Steroidobacteraceae bacterium]
MSSERAEDHAALLQTLAALVAARWPLIPTLIQPIKVRENAVFAAHLQDGGKVVLRVHRCGYHSDAALHSERTWMQALADHGIDVPRHVLSKTGMPFESTHIEGFEGKRQIDVFHWIQGEQLGSVEGGFAASAGCIGDIYRQIGRLAARVHNQSCAWSAPANFKRHAWDAAGLVGENPWWGRFWELDALSGPQRALFLRLKQTLWEDLNEFGITADRYSVIHADLVPENILVDGTHLQVIDFDDAGFGWHLFELATPLYFIRREPVYQEARDALIEGYRQVRPLPEAHLARLPMFLAARGSTYLGWVHTRRNEPAAREMVSQLIEFAVAAAEDYLR